MRWWAFNSKVSFYDYLTLSSSSLVSLGARQIFSDADCLFSEADSWKRNMWEEHMFRQWMAETRDNL